MGGRYEAPSNRQIDRRNELWLAENGGPYPFRYTTKGMALKPETVAHEIANHFIRIPFPGKSQTVWGFEQENDVMVFKKHFVSDIKES